MPFYRNREVVPRLWIWDFGVVLRTLTLRAGSRFRIAPARLA